MVSEKENDVPKWCVQVIPEYQKVISSVTSLAAASLIIPLFFLRDLSGIRDGEALWPYLSCAVYISWLFLCLSIFSGIMYQYFSVRWIKKCYGGETWFSFLVLDKLLDIAFWGAAIPFMLGIVFLIIFAATLQYRGG